MYNNTHQQQQHQSAPPFQQLSSEQTHHGMHQQINGQMIQVNAMGNPMLLSSANMGSGHPQSYSHAAPLHSIMSDGTIHNSGSPAMGLSGTSSSATFASGSMGSATTLSNSIPDSAPMQHSSHLTLSQHNNTNMSFVPDQTLHQPHMQPQMGPYDATPLHQQDGPLYMGGPSAIVSDVAGVHANMARAIRNSHGANQPHHQASVPAVNIPMQMQIPTVNAVPNGHSASVNLGALAALGPAMCSVPDNALSQNPQPHHHNTAQGNNLSSQIPEAISHKQQMPHQPVSTFSENTGSSRGFVHPSDATLGSSVNSQPSGTTPTKSVSNPASSPANNSTLSPSSTIPSSTTMSSSPSSVQNGSGGSASANTTPAVSAACLACRAKHLKCDGAPRCSRCVITESECVYIASRRGYKGPKSKPTTGNPHKRRAETDSDDLFVSTIAEKSAAATTGSSCPMLLGQSSNVPVTTSGSPLGNIATSNMYSSASDGSSPFSTYGGGVSNSQIAQVARSYDTSHLLLSPAAAAAAAAAMGTGMIPTQTSVLPVPERCLESYYHHFFAAHPFTLPKEQMLRLAKDGRVDHLVAAMRYVGSLFINVGAAGAGFFAEAKRLIYDPSTPKDGFLVQAMLLLILGLDGNCQREQAREILADIERISVDLGLNTRAFATQYGRGIAVLEESWRRTWWDLFVVDGMIAGVHRETNFALYDVSCDVALPCEEEQYLSGKIPQPMYLDDLENADFSGEEREFSSFAYRIQCGRILGRMMRTPEFFGPDDENLHKLETLLTNWRLHLPPSKRDALKKNLQMDEMMFQATMMNRAISIMLHQPFSQLDSSATRDVNSCSEHQPIASGQDFNSHTRHTVESANDISKMITHRVALLSHTHFFTCVVTLSSIVHLSKWALYFMPHDDDDLRQQIRLNIGALNDLSRVWKAASTACGQVRGVAQDIYKGKKAQADLPGFWNGIDQEQVLNRMATDESFMSEINALTSAPIITSAEYVYSELTQ